jgi:hypothetical protein
MVNFRWRVFLEINNGGLKNSNSKIDSCGQRFGFILSKAKLVMDEGHAAQPYN